MDFDKLKGAIHNTNNKVRSSGNSNSTAGQATQTIQNWTNAQSANQQAAQTAQNSTESIGEALKRLNVQNDRQNETLKSTTEANDLQKFMKGAKDLGDQISDATGFNDAWSNFKESPSVGGGVEAATKFVSGLPFQVIGGVMGAPTKAYEAATGENIQEMQHDNKTGKDYISTQKLDAEQRLAVAGDAAIDIVGIPFGGTGKLAKGVIGAVTDAAGKDVLKGVGSIAKDVVGGAAEEAGEEFTQTFLENIRGTEEEHGIQNVTGDNFGKTLAEATESAALGAAGGGIMGGVGHGINAMRTNRADATKGDSAAGIGNPAPTTPRNDYHEQGVVDSTGHLTQTSQKWIEDEAKKGGTTDEISGVQSAKNLTSVDDKLGQNEFAMGWDDLRRAMNNNQPHGEDGASSRDVHMEALGGEDKINNFLATYNADPANADRQVKDVNDLFSTYTPQKGESLQSAQENQEKHDQVRIDALNEYLNGNKATGAKGHDALFVMGKNPANEQQLRGMYLARVNSGTGYHLNSANHKAFNSDTDGDTLFATPHKAFHWKDPNNKNQAAFSWQRYADETTKPVQVKDSQGNVSTYDAHVKDRNGTTERANTVKSELNSDGSLPKWGKEGKATDGLIDDLSRLAISNGVTDGGSLQRIKNAARSFSRFNAFYNGAYDADSSAVFEHDSSKNGEICTTASKLQNVVLEEIAKAQGFDLKSVTPDRALAKTADSVMNVIDRGFNKDFVEQTLQDNNAATALDTGVKEIQDRLNKKYSSGQLAPAMSAEEFGASQGRVSELMEQAFGYMDKLVSIHVSYDDLNSPQLFRDSQSLLYKVKGCLTEAGCESGVFQTFIEEYIATLMHINQLTEANIDMTKGIMADYVRIQMETKYSNGIPTDKAKLDEYLTDFARYHDQGVAMVEHAYKEANVFPDNKNTSKEGKVKDFSKIVPSRITKQKINDETSQYEFDGKEQKKLYSSFMSTYGRNSIGFVFAQESELPFNKCTIASVVNMTMTNPDFTYSYGITGNGVVDTFLKNLKDSELNQKINEGKRVYDSIDSVTEVMPRIVKDINKKTGEVNAKDAIAFTNILDYVSQLLGAKNAVSMGIIDINTIFKAEHAEDMTLVRSLLESQTKEEFLSRLLAVKMHADFKDWRAVHQDLINNKITDPEERAHVTDWLVKKADEIGQWSPMHKLIVNHMIRYEGDTTLPDHFDTGVLDLFCDPDMLWSEKVETINMLNQDLARQAWNPDIASSVEGKTNMLISWMLDDKDAHSSLSKKSSRMQDAFNFIEQAKRLDDAKLQADWKRAKDKFSGHVSAHKLIKFVCSRKRRRVSYDIISGQIIETIYPSSLVAEKGTDAVWSSAVADMMTIKTNGAIDNSMSLLTNGIVGNITEKQFNDDGYWLLSVLIDERKTLILDMENGGTSEPINKRSLFADAGIEYRPGEELSYNDIDALAAKYPQLLTALCEQEAQLSPIGDARTSFSRKRGLYQTLDNAYHQLKNESKANVDAEKEELFFNLFSTNNGRRLILSFIDTSSEGKINQDGIQAQLKQVRDNLYDMLEELREAKDLQDSGLDGYNNAYANKCKEICEHFGIKTIQALESSIKVKDIYETSNSASEAEGRLVSSFTQDVTTQAITETAQKDMDKILDEVLDFANDPVLERDHLQKRKFNNLIKNLRNRGSLERAVDVVAEDIEKKLDDIVLQTMDSHLRNLSTGYHAGITALMEAAKYPTYAEELKAATSAQYKTEIDRVIGVTKNKFDKIFNDPQAFGFDSDGLLVLEGYRNLLIERLEGLKQDETKTSKYFYEVADAPLSKYELNQDIVDRAAAKNLPIPDQWKALGSVLRTDWINELVDGVTNLDDFAAAVANCQNDIENSWHTGNKPLTEDEIKAIASPVVSGKKDAAYFEALDNLEDLFKQWNMINGRGIINRATLMDRSDLMANEDIAATVTNTIENVGELHNQLTKAINGEGVFADLLDKRINQTRLKESHSHGNWRNLTVHTDAASVWTASRAAFQAGTGGIPSGVAADNMLNRSMAPIYMAAGDTVCGEPGKKQALGSLNFNDVVNGYYWYSRTGDPKDAQLLNDVRFKELSRQGISEIHIWDSRTHAQHCTCPCCKLQAPAPKGSLTPNYGPLKDVIRRYINGCEPAWLKRKKSMDKGLPLDRTVTADQDLINKRSVTIQNSSNYKGKNSSTTDFHAWMEQEGLALDANGNYSPSTGYRNRYFEVLRDSFMNDDFYKLMEFGSTEARVLSNFLTNYVDIKIGSKTKATVTLTKLKQWDQEIQNDPNLSFQEILKREGMLEENAKPKIELEFKPVSLHSMAQLAADHSLKRAAEMGAFEEGGTITQEQYAQFVAEAFNLENGATFKTVPIKDVMANYGTRTSYMGAKRKVGWAENATNVMRRNIQKALDPHSVYNSHEYNNVNLHGINTEHGRDAIKGSVRAYKAIIGTKEDIAGTDISLGYIFTNSNVANETTGKNHLRLGNNGKQINKADSSVRPDVYGDNYVVNICADRSMLTSSINWLHKMSYCRGAEKRSLLVPASWYEEWRQSHPNDERVTDSQTNIVLDGTPMVRLMPQKSYLNWTRSRNGETAVKQMDTNDIFLSLIANNTDIPDGGVVFMRNKDKQTQATMSAAGNITLSKEGKRKIPVSEWNNGDVAQLEMEFISANELKNNDKLLDVLTNDVSAGKLESWGFDLQSAQEQTKMSKDEQAQAIQEFAKAIVKRPNRTTFIDGTVAKGQCIGILTTKDINGVKHYQPIFADGTMPKMCRIDDVNCIDGSNIEISWSYRRNLLDALDNGQPQKLYTDPAFKAEATIASPELEEMYQLFGKDTIDSLISMETWGSRAKGKERDQFAKNMYYLWCKREGGSVFYRHKDKNTVVWNPDLSKELVDANGKPTPTLAALIRGDQSAWKAVADGEIRIFRESNTQMDPARYQEKTAANDAIQSLASRLVNDGSAVNPICVLTDRTIRIVNGEPTLGDRYLVDWGDQTSNMFGFNGNVDVQMAFWHNMNNRMCAASFNEEQAALDAARTNSSDPNSVPEFKYTSDNKILVQGINGSAPWWCDYTCDKWRVGQENNEFTSTGVEGNIGSQQQLKFAADGYHLPPNLVRYNAMLANALGQGDPRYVFKERLQHDRAKITAKARDYHGGKREIEVLNKKYATMDEYMPTWAYSKGKHAEAVDAIGKSFAQSPAKIIDPNGNTINYAQDETIKMAVQKFSLALTGSANGISTFEAINWFYKFHIGYTSAEHADISFYASDVIDGLNTMAENLTDGSFLPIKGGITKTFANASLGERIGMPILPPHLLKRCWEMNPNLRQKYGNNIEAWKKAQLEEFMKSRDEILATTDTAKRTNLSKFAEWIGLKNGLDTNLWAWGDIYVTQDFREFNEQLLEALNYIMPKDLQRAKELAAKTQKRVEDSRMVRREHYANQYTDADGNATVAMEDGMAQEQAYKVIRGMSAMNKLMRLLNPLITAGAITERGVYTTMTKAVLFANDKLGIGPYKHIDEYDFKGRFDLVKACSQDKNSLMLFNLIRENEVNGDFTWNYEEFTDINQFIANLKKNEQNKMKIEKWQRKLNDVIAGKGLFAKGQIENFWNFFCTYGMQHAAKGEAEWQHLFAPTEQGGKSIFQTELENGGAARLMARVLSPESPYRDVAIVALNHSKRCDMAQRSAIGMIWSEFVRDRPVCEALITSNFCPFINYSINTTERVLNFIAPISTVRYVFINLISKYNGKFPGKDITWDQLHLEDAQLTDSLKEAIALDCAKMGSAAFAAILISLSGAVEPPEDEDKWQNTEEWTIFGLRIRENWWLSDLIGPAMAMVCFARSWELGKPRLDIMTNKLGECLYSNPALKVGGLINDIFNPWDAAADAAETDSDIYGNTKQGDVSWGEMIGTDATMYAMNYMCQFITPAALKELYRDTQQYNVSYKKVYKTDENGNIIYDEDGTPQTEYTNYFDAKVRKLAKQNPVWAVLCDIVTGQGGSTSGTGYMASEMPNVVIYDPEQIASYKTFSLYNDDGTEKSDSEKEAVALAVISLLQGNDLDELKSEGFAVPYDTLKYTGDVVKSIINKNSDVYKQFVDDGGMDYYKQGNGDYNLGKEQVEKIKAAYDNDTQYWKSFYYDVLWSDQMKQSITKYNQYNTLYAQDRQGNYYATGFARSPLPVLIAQGTTTDAGETTGWANDWGTASAVTGNTMYDTNGNALRALEPYQANVDTPELDTSSSYSSGWKNYGSGYSGRSYGGRSYGHSSGGHSSYARSGGSVYSNAKSGYANSLSYRSYNAGDLTNLTTSRANIYGSNLDYIKPAFTIKGSRGGYKKSDY